MLHEKSTSTGVTFTRNYVTVWIDIFVLSRKNKIITAFPWRDFFHIRIGSLYSFSCTTVSFVNQPLSTRVSPLYVPKRSIWIGSFWEPSLHAIPLISSIVFFCFKYFIYIYIPLVLICLGKMLVSHLRVIKSFLFPSLFSSKLDSNAIHVK